MKQSIFKKLLLTVTVFVLSAIFAQSVFANSSWHWLTNSPLVVFPFAVIFTLLIEIIGVKLLAEADNWVRVGLSVTLANIISFFVPYLLRMIEMKDVSMNPFLASFEKGPFYIVLPFYLILTLLAELPIVYFMLRDNVQSERRLAIVVLVLNIITTTLVAMAERTLCIGDFA